MSYSLTQNKIAKKKSDAIINFTLLHDEELSIKQANDEFYRFFETDIKNFEDIYQNKFHYTLTFQDQMKQKKEMSLLLSENKIYESIVDVITASGRIKKILIHIEKIMLKETGEKIVDSVLQATFLKGSAQPMEPILQYI